MENNFVVLYSRSIFNISAVQKSRFNELLKMAKLLNESCVEGENMLEGFTNLLGDCWYAFYNKEVTLIEDSSAMDDMHYAFIAQLIKEQEYIQWHELTKGDELLSVLTTIGIADQLLKSMKHSEMQNKRINELFSNVQNSSQTTGNKKQQMQEHIIHLSKTSIRTMIRQNKKKIHNTKKAMLSIGKMNGKKIDHIPLREQFELVAIIREKKELRLIAELVGRFKKIALKKQKMKQSETIQSDHISFGQELSRLLPLELANYMMGQSKLDFLKRYSEQQAFIFNTKGKDRRGRGPIIICIDESSSMTSIKEQSKAFCIALLTIAKKQKRDFAIIPFASNVGNVKFFKKGQASIQDLIQFSESFLGGGTNYEGPLRESLNMLLQSELKKADLLFVTDGSSFLTSRFVEQFNEVKKQRKFECTAVVLNNLFSAVDLNIVQKFSDRVIEVNELFEAEDAFIL